MPRSFHLVLLAVAVLCQSATSRSDLAAALPAGLDRGFQTHNTEHFSIIHSSTVAEDEKMAYMLELAYRHFTLLFESRDFQLRTPAQKLTWITFADEASFNRYTNQTEHRDLSWLTGYYSAGTNVVATITPQRISTWQTNDRSGQTPDVIACPPDAEADLAKLIHEAAHQLSFNTGLLKRRVMYPMWASEGLAMVFERSLLSQYFHSSRYASLRAEQLARLYRRKQLIRLDELISMNRMEQDASAIDVYAQAWGLFQFLCDHRADSLRQYLSSLYDLEPGWRSEQTLRKEFVRAFGPLDQLDRQWQRFLEDLPSGR